MVFPIIKELNERSKVVNGASGAVYIQGEEEYSGFGTPSLFYESVNCYPEELERISVQALVAQIIMMDIYVVNIEVIEDLVNHFYTDADIHSIEVSYSPFGYLVVSYLGARVGLFLPCELVREDAAKTITKRVRKTCKRNLLPITDEDLKSLESEINRCIIQDTRFDKVLKIENYVPADVKLF